MAFTLILYTSENQQYTHIHYHVRNVIVIKPFCERKLLTVYINGQKRYKKTKTNVGFINPVLDFRRKKDHYHLRHSQERIEGNHPEIKEIKHRRYKYNKLN